MSRLVAQVTMFAALIACGGPESANDSPDTAGMAPAGSEVGPSGGGDTAAGATQAAGDTAVAAAELRNTKGQAVGNVTLRQTREGVALTAELSGAPQGVHAFHIHETGQCEPPAFKSAGGHFNPAKRQHGTKNPRGAHAGDLPNIDVAPDGRATAEMTAANVTLSGGANALLDADGAAVVLHAKADDYRTDPTGNAGDRVACGVITRGSR